MSLSALIHSSPVDYSLNSASVCPRCAAEMLAQHSSKGWELAVGRSQPKNHRVLHCGCLDRLSHSEDHCKGETQ